MHRNERFRGRLMAGAHMVIDSIEGSLKTQPRSGGALGEWTGFFEVPANLPEPLVDGNRYRIELIDGRSGTVSVRISRAEDPEKAAVKFHGTGSFRR